MEDYLIDCDMGSIKIFNKDLSLFFLNNQGDVTNLVWVLDNRKEIPNDVDFEFIGHFTVKTEAYLSWNDCTDMPVHTFKRGRWFVELNEDDGPFFVIYKVDEDVHA